MRVIPSTLEGLTADWLADALAVDVTDCRLLDAHAGTTGRALLELQYAAETELPPRLFAKLPPTDANQRAFVTATGMGKRESRFYRELSGEIPVRVPHCYYADWDDTGEHYIMLLENLEDSGCTFRAASGHYSLEYVRGVVAAFARLHAQYWQSPRFSTDLSWLQPPMQHEIGVNLVGAALERQREEMPAVFVQLGELYTRRADDIHALWERGTPTLIHGDVHDGNLFLDDGEPGFLDWAIVSRAPGMRDVSYFLSGTLAPEHRDQQRELIQFYREELLRHGVEAPSMEELWEQHRWHALYVWVGAVTTLAMGDEWQPVSYVTAVLQRLHPVLSELDTVGAVKSAIS